jgi:hypothetical protein
MAKKTIHNDYLEKLEAYAHEKEVVFGYLQNRLAKEQDEERKKQIRVHVDQAEAKWLDAKDLYEYAKGYK